MKFLKHKDLLISLSLVGAATLLERMLHAGAPAVSLLAYFCVVVFAITHFEFPRTMAVSILSLQFFVFSGGRFVYRFPGDLFGVLLFILSCVFIRKLFLLRDEKLRESEKRLTKEREGRYSFVLALSQGLKEPLHVLQVCAQYIREKEPGTEKFAKAVVLVDENTERIRSTMRDISDTAAIASGKALDLTFEDLHLRTIILEGLIPFEKAYPGKFKTDFTPDSSRARWSEDGIRRIVRVLCENAVTHGDAKEIEIKLIEDVEHATLIVKNTGPVISPADLANLFTPFQRMLNGTVKDSLGLSLPLVKAIVEAHGGNIKVISNRDEGTVFQVLLPKIRMHA